MLCAASQQIPLRQQACRFKLSDEEGAHKLVPLHSQKCTPCHLFPEHWESEATKIAEKVSSSSTPVVVVVLGHQGCGKSSFFRHMINYLLNSVPQVGVLELDVGQPEFEIPGMMTMGKIDSPLLGAPGTHKTDADYRIFFGSTSPAADPKKYLAAVRRMSEWWHDSGCQLESHQHLPLIVNTCGWISGLGELLQKRTIETLKPSHIFAFGGSGQKDTEVDQLIQVGRNMSNDSGAAPQIIILPSMRDGKLQYLGNAGDLNELAQQYDIPDKCPTEQRSLMYLRWAARCLKRSSKAVIAGKKENMHKIANSLAALHPWKVDLASIHVHFLFGKVHASQILGCMNGAMVGFCKANETIEGEDWEESATCVGVGLVRAIDLESNQIFILTDIDSETIHQVDLIQVGKLRAPAALCLTNRHHPSWMVPRAFVNHVF